MLTIDIPGRQLLEIDYLILDFNGTLALDGQLIEGVDHLIQQLATHLKLLIVTADTHGSVEKVCRHLPVELYRFPTDRANQAKRDLVKDLGPSHCACVGNGWNDVAMMKIAALAVGVLEEEGLCAAVVSEADLFTRSIHSALELFLHPDRIRASLRN